VALDALDIVGRVRAALPDSDAKVAEGTHVPTIEVEPGSMPAVLTLLRDEPDLQCRLFVDATAIDREPVTGKVEVVYVVRSTLDFAQCFVVKAVLDAQRLSMPTSSGVYAGANWAEREIYDMFGVVFDGHPDLRRILMYPEFEGHALRKSYPYQKRQSLVPERDPLANPWPKRG